MKTQVSILSALIFIFLQLFSTPTLQAQAQLPNIVFIIIDDLGMSTIPTYANKDGGAEGWISSSSTGANPIPFSTPNLTEFGKQSKIYTNMYATPLCAPTRGQIMTGRYPFRNGMTYPAWNHESDAAPYYPNNLSSNEVITRASGFINTDQVCFPEVLASMGYKTIFGGKWNLRYGISMSAFDNTGSYTTFVNNQENQLYQCGFQETFGPTAVIGHTIDYYPPQLSSNPNTSDQYLPYDLNEWIIQSIENSCNRQERYYLHYSLGLVHGQDNDPPPPNHPEATNVYNTFVSKIEVVDSLIGVLVSKIDELDRANGTETMIIITGDNGTEPSYYSKYQDTWVQGGKGTSTSHGSRVPFMVRWPGVIAANYLDATLTDFSDIFPTFIELVNGEVTLQSLIANKIPGYQLCNSIDNESNNPNNCYLLDGRSLLHGMTGGQRGLQNRGHRAIYSQQLDDAFVADANYQIRINANNLDAGVYQINNETLEDKKLKSLSNVAIGDPLPANPFDINTERDNYWGYHRLYEFYENLFPQAGQD